MEILSTYVKIYMYENVIFVLKMGHVYKYLQINVNYLSIYRSIYLQYMFSV